MLHSCAFFITICPLALSLLAQQPDPISGATGWVGAGLLGGVLAWLLFKHLPAKDAQLDKLITDHNSRIEVLNTNNAKQIEVLVTGQREYVKEMVANFVEAIKELRMESRESLKIITERFDRQMDGISKFLQTDMEQIAMNLERLTDKLDKN